MASSQSPFNRFYNPAYAFKYDITRYINQGEPEHIKEELLMEHHNLHLETKNVIDYVKELVNKGTEYGLNKNIFPSKKSVKQQSESIEIGNEELKHAIAIALKMQLEKMEIGEILSHEVCSSAVDTVKKDENTFNLNFRGFNVADVSCDLNNKTYNIEIFNENIFKVWGDIIIEAILEKNGITFSNK